MSRLNGMAGLDRGFHDRFYLFMKHLQAEDPRFQAFETIRSPARQEELFRQGGVTRARAYQSAHQYGKAADVWPVTTPGQWEWIKADDPRWQPLIELAPQFGLECLSWERPHVQLAGFRWQDEKPGPLDTEGWLKWLEDRNGAA